MEKLKRKLQAAMVAGMLLFFAWLALSWWEIGMGYPPEGPQAGRYNAFVMLTGTGEQGFPERAA